MGGGGRRETSREISRGERTRGEAEMGKSRGRQGRRRPGWRTEEKKKRHTERKGMGDGERRNKRGVI